MQLHAYESLLIFTAWSFDCLFYNYWLSVILFRGSKDV